MLKRILQEEYRVVEYSEDLAEVTGFDAVLCINRMGYRQIRNLLNNLDVPVVYCFCKSDMVQEFPYDHASYSRIIAVEAVLK